MKVKRRHIEYEKTLFASHRVCHVIISLEFALLAI